MGTVAVLVLVVLLAVVVLIAYLYRTLGIIDDD
jgi:hypothetical protein